MIQTKKPENKELIRRFCGSKYLKGKINRFPYAKLVGAYWILNLLIELNNSMKDEGLIPMREQGYQWIFSDGKDLI